MRRHSRAPATSTQSSTVSASSKRTRAAVECQLCGRRTCNERCESPTIIAIVDNTRRIASSLFAGEHWLKAVAITFGRSDLAGWVCALLCLCLFLSVPVSVKWDQVVALTRSSVGWPVGLCRPQRSIRRKLTGKSGGSRDTTLHTIVSGCVMALKRQRPMGTVAPSHKQAKSQRVTCDRLE